MILLSSGISYELHLKEERNARIGWICPQRKESPLSTVSRLASGSPVLTFQVCNQINTLEEERTANMGSCNNARKWVQGVTDPGLCASIKSTRFALSGFIVTFLP